MLVWTSEVCGRDKLSFQSFMNRATEATFPTANRKLRFLVVEVVVVVPV